MAISSISSGSSIKSAGLVTGLDTESLVKQMASGTQAKIDRQKQSLQLLQWKQNDYRDVIDKITAVKDKYFNMLEPSTNLSSSSLFGQRTSSSTLAGLIVSSNSGASEETYNITNIISKAKAAGITSSSKDVDGIKLDFDNAESGKEYTVNVKLDGLSKEVKFTAGADADATKTAFLNAVNGKFASTGKSFSYENDRMVFTDSSNVNLKHTFDIQSTTTDKSELKALGLDRNASSQMSLATKISDVAFKTDLKGNSFSFYINDKEFSFSSDTTIGNVINTINNSDAGAKVSYDTIANKFSIEATDSGAGSSLKIAQKSGNLLNAMFGDSCKKIEGPYAGSQLLQKDYIKGNVPEDGKGFGFDDGGVSGEIKDLINQSVNVTVNGKTEKITLWQYDARGSKNDFSSPKAVLSQLNDQLSKKFGNDAPIFEYDSTSKQFKLSAADPNQEVTIAAAEDTTGGSEKLLTALGFNDSNNTNIIDTANTKISSLLPDATISGKLCFGTDTSDTYEINENTTVQDLIDNSNGCLSFENGSFILKGVNIDGCDDNAKHVLSTIFGEGYNYPGVPPVTFDQNDSSISLSGENAVIEINGTQMASSSNTFTVNGTNINIDNVALGEVSATVSTTKDTTKAADAIKEFIKDYNALISDLNTQMDTMRPTDTGKIGGTKYDPLTDAQKDDMTDKEIENWDVKAKQGMLYQDSNLRDFLSDIRSSISSGTNLIKLQNMGITVSTNYKDNGKLEIDETKLSKALNDDADGVLQFFTKEDTGFADSIKSTINKYVGTTGNSKGVLITLAGKTNTSSTADNSISKQLETYQERIATLQKNYETETARYWSKFTQLETITQKYNSQSEWLSSQFGSNS